MPICRGLTLWSFGNTGCAVYLHLTLLDSSVNPTAFCTCLQIMYSTYFLCTDVDLDLEDFTSMKKKKKKKTKKPFDMDGLDDALQVSDLQIFCYYSLIAFDERVTFWLQRVWSLPCACAYVALFARRLTYNHYTIAHAYNAANAQGKTGRVEAKKLLSRQRQSEYKHAYCKIKVLE